MTTQFIEIYNTENDAWLNGMLPRDRICGFISIPHLLDSFQISLVDKLIRTKLHFILFAVASLLKQLLYHVTSKIISYHHLLSSQIY